MRTSSYIITAVKADANPPPPKLVVVFPINIGVLSIDLTGDSIYNFFIFYFLFISWVATLHWCQGSSKAGWTHNILEKIRCYSIFIQTKQPGDSIYSLQVDAKQ
jgi:hypothetical protein